MNNRDREALGRCVRLVSRHICPMCKEYFLMWCAPSRYGWSVRDKGEMKYFCSYGCMRTYEKPRIEKSREKAMRQYQGGK